MWAAVAFCMCIVDNVAIFFSDYLEWDYTMLGDDTVHRIPGGPMDYPDGR